MEPIHDSRKVGDVINTCCKTGSGEIKYNSFADLILIAGLGVVPSTLPVADSVAEIQA
jgi:hypothetical protein